MTDMLVVLEHPLYDESKIQNLLDLQQSLDFTILYAIEHNPFKDDFNIDKTKLVNELSNSAESLIDRINIINPKKIMVCGSPLSLLFASCRVSEGVQKTDLMYGEIPLIVNYSPILVTNNPGFKKVFYSKFDMEKPPCQMTPHTICDNFDQIQQVFDYCLQTGYCAFDFETDNDEGHSALEWFREKTRPTCVTISFQPGYSYVIPLYHEESPFDEDDIIIIWEMWKPMWHNFDMQIIAHNLMFDLHFIFKYDIKDIQACLHDTMLMHHIWNENEKQGLKKVGDLYFPQFSGYDDGIDFKGPLDQLCKYAATDSDLTIRCFFAFRLWLLNDDPDGRLYTLYRNYTMAGFKPLFNASHYGAKIDKQLIEDSIAQASRYKEAKEQELMNYSDVRDFIEIKSRQEHAETLALYKEKLEMHTAKRDASIQKKIDKNEAEILAIENEFPNEDDRPNSAKKKLATRMARREKFNAEKLIPNSNMQNYIAKLTEIKLNPVRYEMNFGSPVKLGDLLYSEEGFNFDEFIIDGQYKRTTNRDYLSQIDHPFMNILFAQRSISKMLSTYYKPIRDKLDSNDYLHGNFKLHGTRTGRLSSSDPNLQNIPSRMGFKDPEAEWCLKQVKKFFVPPSDDYYLVQADYSQAELRVIANNANDPTMKAAYLNGEDLHAKTAAQIHNMTVEDLKASPDYKSLRNDGKPANFGWVYKSSIDGYREFAKSSYGIDITEMEAHKHKDAIFKTYDQIGPWHDRMEKKCKKFGHVRTLFGRKRRLPDIYSSIPSLQNQAIRNCINNPVQGTSGEWAVFAAAVLEHVLPNDVWFFNTVHDSVFYYIPKHKLDYCLGIISKFASYPPIKLYFNVEPGEVPMKLDFEISEVSWGDQQEYDFKN